MPLLEPAGHALRERVGLLEGRSARNRDEHVNPLGATRLDVRDCDDGMEDRLRSRRLRRPCLSVEGGSRGRERVVECLDCFSPGRRVKHEPSSLALVHDLDAKHVLELSSIPIQVNDDSFALAMTEMISRGQHFPPPILEMNGCTNMDPIVLERGGARIVGAPRFDPQCLVARPLERRRAGEGKRV